MKSYLYTAVEYDGSRRAGRILAANIAAARAQLEKEGRRDIVFESEDFGDYPVAEGVDPALELEARRTSGLWPVVWMALKGNAGVLAPLLAWNAWSLYEGRPFSWVDGLGFGSTIALAVFLAWALTPALLFQRLLEAVVWGRWRDVQRMRRWLSRVRGLAPLPPHMLDYWEAKALIGLGRTREGLRLFERWTRDAAVPEALAVGLMGSLHDSARDFERALACQRRVVELNPDNAQSWVDVAQTCARYGLDADEAGRAVDEALRREQTPLVAAVLDHVRGIIALDKGDAAAALVHFERAMHGVRKSGGSESLKSIVADVQGFSAVAAMRLGRRDVAAALWRGALPIIRAQRSQELIDRFAAAAAGKPWNPPFRAGRAAPERPA